MIGMMNTPNDTAISNVRSRLGGVTGRGWLPGASGNARGRKPGSASLTAAMRRVLTRADAEEIAAKVIAMAKEGDLAAVKILLDRLDAFDFEQRLAALEAAASERRMIL